jgi:hypothetical protein
MSVSHANSCVERPGIGARDVFAIALFLAVLAPISWRLYEHRPVAGDSARDHWALASFRDAMYYPILAVHDGVNPYDVVRDGNPLRYMQRYPVRDTFPLYSPLILLVFAPFAALPVLASMTAFTALNVALLLLLAWITLKSIGRQPGIAGIFGLAALLLASQPGRAFFNAGQVSLPLALAAIALLEWGDRRAWSSSLLVAFTTMKITYGGPLGVLLFARRDWRSALGGLALGGLLGLLGLLVVFGRSGDLTPQRMVAVLTANQSDFNTDPTVVPQTNNARVDLVSSLEYLAGRPLSAWAGPLAAAVVLGITAWLLWRHRRPGTAESVITTSSTLAILAMFICIYHNVYDLPLLVLPIAACATAADPTWRRMGPAWRASIVLLLLLPFVNVFWTDGFRSLLGRAGMSWGPSANLAFDYLYRLCCAANGLALFGAWALIGFCTLRASKPTVRVS